jgi:hypothetical protein
MPLPLLSCCISGLGPEVLWRKQADGKTKVEAKTEKDKRNKKVMTEMETSSRTQRSLSSLNLLPENHGKTTLQQFYHMIDLRGWTKFGCAQDCT